MDARIFEIPVYSRPAEHYENGLPWLYEDVIAWIFIYADGNSIKAGIIQRNERREFEYSGKVGETRNPYTKDSSQIALEIIDLIDRIEEKKFKGQFVERTVFNKIVKYIDWKKLLKEVNIYPTDSEVKNELNL